MHGACWQALANAPLTEHRAPLAFQNCEACPAAPMGSAHPHCRRHRHRQTPQGSRRAGCRAAVPPVPPAVRATTGASAFLQIALPQRPAAGAAAPAAGGAVRMLRCFTAKAGSRQPAGRAANCWRQQPLQQQTTATDNSNSRKRAGSCPCLHPIQPICRRSGRCQCCPGRHAPAASLLQVRFPSSAAGHAP